MGTPPKTETFRHPLGGSIRMTILSGPGMAEQTDDYIAVLAINAVAIYDLADAPTIIPHTMANLPDLEEVRVVPPRPMMAPVPLPPNIVALLPVGTVGKWTKIIMDPIIHGRERIVYEVLKRTFRRMGKPEDAIRVDEGVVAVVGLPPQDYTPESIVRILKLGVLGGLDNQFVEQVYVDVYRRLEAISESLARRVEITLPPRGSVNVRTKYYDVYKPSKDAPEKLGVIVAEASTMITVRAPTLENLYLAVKELYERMLLLHDNTLPPGKVVKYKLSALYSI